MLRQRVLTTLIGLPPLLAAFIWGPAWLVIAIFLGLGAVAWFEYLRLIGRLHLWMKLAGLAGGEALLLALSLHAQAWALTAATASLGLVAGLAVLLYPSRRAALEELSLVWLGLGLFFLPLGLVAALALQPPSGRLWLFFLLGVVFAADVGAYFTGRGWGRKRLFPEVSPGKTWAGLWGGLLSGLLVGALGGSFDGDGADWLLGGLIGLGLAALTVIGDLIVSMIKRTFQVKDASGLLPGHGGLLDRLDSFILAGPGLYLLLELWPD